MTDHQTLDQVDHARKSAIATAALLNGVTSNKQKLRLAAALAKRLAAKKAKGAK